MARIPGMKIGDRIRLARSTARLDAKEIAHALGLSTSAVTSWERGRTQPSLERIEQLAELLDVDVVWLAFGRETVSVAATEGASPDLPTSRYAEAA